MQFSEQQTQYLKSYLRQLRPSLLSYLVCYFDKAHRIVILDNIEKVFGNILSVAEKKKLMHSFYTHQLKMLKEIMVYPFLTKRRLLARTKIKGKEHIEQSIKASKPIIIIGGHLGNWEVLLFAIKIHMPELSHKLAVVRKTIKPQWFSNIIFNRTRASGFTVIPSTGAVNDILQCLKNEKIVFLAIDTRPKNKSIIMNFFGHKTSCHRSIAVLSKKTKVPIVPIRAYRDNEGMHVIEFFPAVPWISCSTVRDQLLENTKQYYHILEQFILEYPEQWRWSYRRWFV